MISESLFPLSLSNINKCLHKHKWNLHWFWSLIGRLPSHRLDCTHTDIGIRTHGRPFWSWFPGLLARPAMAPCELWAPCCFSEWALVSVWIKEFSHIEFFIQYFKSDRKPICFGLVLSLLSWINSLVREPTKL